MSTSAGKKPPAAPPAGSTRKWLVILVLVAGLHFVLGLLVGRGTSPIRFDIPALERELARLREVELQAEIKRFRIAMEGDGEGSAFDFYRELKQDEPVRRPAAGAPPAAVKPPPPVPKAPHPASKPDPAQGEAVRPAGGGTLLQVAALREAQAAERVAIKLRQQGFPVTAVKAQVDGRGTWYRVRVGPFSNPEAARDTRQRLVQLDYKPITVNQ